MGLSIHAAAGFHSSAGVQEGVPVVGPVSLLLLGDSGCAPLNPPEWIAALRPQIVILSVAAGDPEGLPAQAVLDAVQGISLLRTDRAGWITVSTDGGWMWVEVERNGRLVP
ncbi:MAG: hypothetical protein QMD04_13165 [Anaerolineales bacterium]|nr:hypothetical protein [Anaerolineales bacterium]